MGCDSSAIASNTFDAPTLVDPRELSFDRGESSLGVAEEVTKLYETTWSHACRAGALLRLLR